MAQPAGNAKIEARTAALETLVNSVAGGGLSDAVRVMKDSGAYVRGISAPPASHFPVTAGKGAPPAEKARAFLKQHQAVFMDASAAVDFRTKKTKDRPSRSYVRLQQDYSGIPVFGAEATVQLDAAGEVVFAFSDLKRTTDELDSGHVSLSPALSAAEAERSAVKHIQRRPAHTPDARGTGPVEPLAMGWLDPALRLEASPATLMLFAPEVAGTTGPTRLVWQTAISALDDPAVSECVLVDAHSGEIVFHYPLVYAALNRQIYDAANSTSDPGTLKRPEGGAAVGTPVDVDYAYDYFGDTYNFYYTEHGRNSINNAGMTLSATVRYCETTDECPYENAFWSDSAQRMYFGEGYASADDVVGHELTHGVTSYESNLIYFNQSGAINESFSDMWGEWMDQTNGAGTDTPGVKWLMGEDLPIGAIRSMSNPPAYGDPDKMSSAYYNASIGDVGGVHYNSGVGNKLCYLLTDGGTFNGRTISGLGVSAAADLFYECAANLLTSAADYQDLFILLQQAAVNLGYGQAGINNVVEACLAVELGVEPDKMAVAPWEGYYSVLPLRASVHDSRTQSIYLASEIGRSGRITALRLYVYGQVPGQTLNNWTIRMKTTTLSSYESASMDATGWTTCYQGNVTISSTGHATFTFSTPFLYDGASNLMVDFSFNNSTASTDGYSFVYVPSVNRTVYAASNSTNGDPLTWSGTTNPTKYKTTSVPCLALVFSAPSATVTNVTSAHANGAFKAGEVIDIDVTFSTTVQVTGSPTLDLETGPVNRAATYRGGSGTNTLQFRYTAASGDASSDLDYTNGGALKFNGGAIKDTATLTSATLTLPAPGASGSLGANKAIVIDTTAPTVTVNQASGQADPAPSGPINFRILFSEAIDPSTFISTDVAITGTASGTPSVALTTSDNVDWNAAVSGLTAGGTVIASLSAGVCADAAGNTNAASTSTDNTVTLQLPGTVDAHSSPQPDFVLGNWCISEADKVSALKFSVTDHGGDSLATLIDRVIVSVSGTAGHAGQDIAWAELRNAASQIATAASITDTQIIFGATPNSDSVAQLTSVPDKTSSEYTVYLYLNTVLQAGHDQTYVFDIAEPGIGVDGGSSSPMAADSGAITPVTGTLFIMALGLSVTPDSWNIGAGPLNNVVESGAFLVQNLGNLAEDISIKGSNGAGGWTLHSAAGTNTFKVEADSGDDGSYETVISTGEQPVAVNLSASGGAILGLRYTAPSGDTHGAGVAQDFTLTLKASRHVP